MERGRGPTAQRGGVVGGARRARHRLLAPGRCRPGVHDRYDTVHRDHLDDLDHLDLDHLDLDHVDDGDRPTFDGTDPDLICDDRNVDTGADLTADDRTGPDLIFDGARHHVATGRPGDGHHPRHEWSPRDRPHVRRRIRCRRRRRHLDLLAAERIHASFGMTGSWADANPGLVARIAAEGHVLINHTATHPDMTTLSSADRLAELAAAEASVSAITGSGMQPYFRPPYGAYDASVLTDLGRAGYAYSIMWTVDSLGWKGLDPASVAARCLDGAVDGAILLLHVGSQSTDVEALPEIVAGLRASGYTFVTVGQLLQP